MPVIVNQACRVVGAYKSTELWRQLPPDQRCEFKARYFSLEEGQKTPISNNAFVYSFSSENVSQSTLARPAARLATPAGSSTASSMVRFQPITGLDQLTLEACSQSQASISGCWRPPANHRPRSWSGNVGGQQPITGLAQLKLEACRQLQA